MKDTMVSTAADSTSWRQPSWLDRLARRVVERQLERLRHGRLTVAGPFGARTFGRAGDLSATIAVTGAARIFSTFFGFSDLASRSLPAFEVTKINRAGQQFIEVGPAAVIS